jgi:GMP synthase-like glutamine amidotransferase
VVIGLLQCDHVRDEFRSIGGDYDDMFRRWLPAEWRIYDVTAGQRPAGPRECDGYVITGSRASVYDDEPWIQAFAVLTRDLHASGVPTFGVCFGHQMIAHALGGRVSKCPRGWGIGVHQFRVAIHEHWMQPPLDQFGVLMSCQDQAEQLPEGAVVLAGNEHCPVGMFRVGNMLGLQGHPEFSVEYSEALMRFRMEKIGERTVSQALSTLTDPTHATELAAWAQSFLLSH